MSEYTPEYWVKIRIDIDGKPDPLYKILGGWSGGYLDGDSWRINSGIERTMEFDDYYEYHGYSGSVYKCYKQNEGMGMPMAGVLGRMQKGIEGRGTVTIVPASDGTD